MLRILKSGFTPLRGENLCANHAILSILMTKLCYCVIQCEEVKNNISGSKLSQTQNFLHACTTPIGPWSGPIRSNPSAKPQRCSRLIHKSMYYIQCDYALYLLTVSLHKFIVSFTHPHIHSLKLYENVLWSLIWNLWI